MKWVATENLHLTLKFLGGVDTADVVKVCEAVRKAVADLSPFQLEIHGAGAFPNLRRPQTIWLGSRDGGPTDDETCRPRRQGPGKVRLPS